MSLIMVMGMTITASATEPTSSAGAKIEVKGADDADLYYAQVIKADPTKETGWAFTNPQYATLFAAFGTDEQSMIQGWIDASDANGGNEQARLEKLGSVDASQKFEPNPMSVSEPGLYVIKGADKQDAKVKHSYSTMLAYVSLADIAEGKTIVVNVKSTPDTPNKELVDAEADKYVEKDAEVPYKVTVTVPYKPSHGSAALVIKDEISGGYFKLNDERKVDVTVQLANENTPRSMVVTPIDASHIEIDLAELITDNNANANVEVVVSYVAICDGTQNVVNNKATINNNENPSSVNSYTGRLQITKLDANTEKLLDGAQFIIVNGSNYAILKQVNDEYVLDGWTTVEDEATLLTTDETGTATAFGFDKDVIYSFREMTAPKGYSRNTNDAAVQWSGEDEDLIGQAVMTDTTLSELPYTGGKGTAAFTGFGVLLMSVAAGLYYANKKNKTTK